MMRKMLIALLGLMAGVACNNDNEELRNYIDPYLIFNGTLPNGIQLNYLGTATVTKTGEDAFVNDAAKFNIHSLGNGQAAIYMDDMRFAAAMPALDIRIPQVNYSTDHTQKSFNFAVANVIPEANIADTGYRPYERYVITNFTCTLQGEKCTITFTCMGSFNVRYEGNLEMMMQ